MLALRVPVYTKYTKEISGFTIQKRSETTRVLGAGRKSVMMTRVKVNSKSELVEDREGKSALYGVICCCDDRSSRVIVESCNMWSYGLDLRSIKLTVVKVVVSSDGTCNNCLFAEVFNYFLNCSNEIFDFLESNSRFLNFCWWGFLDKRESALVVPQ